MRIFLAGAAGVIGQRLVPLLVADGHAVTGTTRSVERAEWLRANGVEPVSVDVFDAAAIHDVVVQTRPDVVLHQLTDLALLADKARIPEALAANARIRDEGTRNLLASARAAGVARVIAQSIAFAYAPGTKPFTENCLIEPSAHGVMSLEAQVLGGPWAGLVLRYGRLYGPGAAEAPAAPACHVDDAAEVARRAIAQGATGVYNVTDADGFCDSGKARAAFNWTPRG